MAAEPRAGSDAAFEKSVSSVSFESIDFSALRPYQQDRSPNTSEAQFEAVVRRNLQFIYHNKLNRQRFLIAPEPQTVVDQISAILQANYRLNQLIRTAPSSNPSASVGALLEEIRHSTKALKALFNDYFVEGYSSTYVLRLSNSSDRPTLWALYLLESRKICGQLNSRLPEYFLNSAPEAISLRQIRSSSINTLVDALLMLTDSVSKKISGIR